MRFIGSIFLIVLMATTLLSKLVHAQPASPVYATSSLPSNTGTITNPINMIGANTNLQPTIMKVIAGTAWLHINFPAATFPTVSFPTTIYVKVDLSGLGFGTTSIKSYNNSNYTETALVSTSETNKFFHNDGSVYIAATVTNNFQSIRLSLTTPILTTAEIRVYHAFYTQFNTADCGLPNATTVKSAGISLLGSTDILNPAWAIDQEQATPTTSSTFTIGALAVGATLTQTCLFNGQSNIGDGVRIIFSKGTSVTIELLPDISIQAFSGTNPVGNKATIKNLLDLELVGLLSGNSKYEIFFIPTQTGITQSFDRVDITLTIPVGISLGAVLHIFDVRRIPEMPAAQNVSHCDNLGALSIASLSNQESILPNGLTFRWYEQAFGGVSTAIGKILTPLGLTAPVSKEYYVETIKSGCTTTSSSARKRVTVNLIKAPVTPPISLSP